MRHPFGGSQKQRRWSFRVSMRLGVILLSLLCLIFAWVGEEFKRANRQRTVTEWVEQRGARVVLVDRFDDIGSRSISPLSALPDWATWLNRFYFQRVSKVDFDEVRFRRDFVLRDGDLAILANVPKLNELHLSDNQEVSDAGVRHLADLTWLKALTLRRTGVTGAGLQHLRCRHLQRLDLDDTRLGDDGLVFLRAEKFPELAWLSLSKCTISDDSLNRLSKLESLETLVLSDTSISDDQLPALAGLHRLRRLALVGTRVSADGIAELQSSLPKCRIVWRNERRMLVDTVRSLGGSVVLTRPYDVPADVAPQVAEHLFDTVAIEVHSRFFNDVHFEWTQYFPGLQRLSISQCRVTNRSLESLDQLPRLAELDLSGLGIDDDGMEAIGRVPSIQVLSFSNTRVTNTGFKRIAPLQALRQIQISGRYITDEGIRHLALFPNLKTIVVSFARCVDGHQFEHLARLEELEVLILRDTGILDEDKVIDGLSKLQQLKHLRITGNELSEERVARLRRSLPTTRIEYVEPAHGWKRHCD